VETSVGAHGYIYLRMSERDIVPRGRHAPPLEVRQDRQLQRLSDAAAAVFARVGYADSTAEAIAREAGMSKATFYEHFSNKEDCIIGLFDRAMDRLIGAMEATRHHNADLTPAQRYAISIRGLLAVIDAFRNHARTLLIEIIGAGPRAMARRDAFLDAIADYIAARNAEDVAAGRSRPLESRDDAYAVVGAALELASRQIRTGVPEDIMDLAPSIERLFLGVLAATPDSQPAAT
jgi:AcrR family transcriptional regulator